MHKERERERERVRDSHFGSSLLPPLVSVAEGDPGRPPQPVESGLRGGRGWTSLGSGGGLGHPEQLFARQGREPGEVASY